MKKSSVLFLVDIVSALLMLFLLFSGLIMYYILPPGSGHFRKLLGMSRHEWGDIHFMVALLLLASITFHLILHWKWIRCMWQKWFSG